MSAPADLLEGFPVVLQFPVAWGDMDSFGHVNNTVYFRYFEHGRIACFGRLGVMEVMKSTGVGPILAHTSCRFRVPLSYPDTVHIGTRIDDVGDDRFVMHYRVVSERHGAVAAEGDGRIVMFDYQGQTKAALPGVLRERIAAL